jgi:hypothetical protein
MTEQEILEVLQVTPEQLDRCTRLIDLNVTPPVVFYRCQSESSDDVYEVRHAKRGFSCTCKSGQIAFSNVYNKFRVCKHCRWSLAYERIYQAEKQERKAADEAAERLAEVEKQAHIEKLVSLGLTTEQATAAVNSGSDQDDATLARVYGAKPRASQGDRKGTLYSSHQGFSLMH